MARFFGVIGFKLEDEETSPGVWKEVVVEHNYYGDILRNAREFNGDDKVNPDVSISNSISIVADEFANENISAMRYVSWRGLLHSITNVEVQHPRLLLRLGGVYRGARPTLDPSPETG